LGSGSSSGKQRYEIFTFNIRRFCLIFFKQLPGEQKRSIVWRLDSDKTPFPVRNTFKNGAF
jgi:hypothetical protein